MIMPMMNIGIVRVSVLDRSVAMSVDVRLTPIPVPVVLMLVMCVMNVRVFMLQRQMPMQVSVLFRRRSHAPTPPCGSTTRVGPALDGMVS